MLWEEDDDLLRDLIYEMSRAENFIHYVYNIVFGGVCVCVCACLSVGMSANLAAG